MAGADRGADIGAEMHTGTRADQPRSFENDGWRCDRSKLFFWCKGEYASNFHGFNRLLTQNSSIGFIRVMAGGDSSVVCATTTLCDMCANSMRESTEGNGLES